MLNFSGSILGLPPVLPLAFAAARSVAACFFKSINLKIEFLHDYIDSGIPILLLFILPEPVNVIGFMHFALRQRIMHGFLSTLGVIAHIRKSVIAKRITH
ncbi:hypothetical protein HRM2_34510 [Desulforapulum autotrophicum HRM2]|uniref:Uncharacterized protein n=1 Tax=Desulforapulum autotrophicum (strain ATCC 43914 / DSM 3382 / VKM B-1955 / HRM2) TaxID=177437 RepID=C0Q921_DESAH|nr:hypothetical protein [Desulforapulum autotrophicum]ACN16526.1 hypothetical protein HRM2_34510 [Desulforapulum autotrophicum HRM2]